MSSSINTLQLTAFYEAHKDDYYQTRNGNGPSEWGEQYKWDILPSLNQELAAYPVVTADNFADIIAKIQKSNPNAGSFAHWIDMDDLDLLVKSTNGYQVLRDLWTASPNTIDSEINTANSVSALILREKKFSPSTYGFILAAKDCGSYAIYRDWVSKEVAAICSTKLPSAQGDKYKLLNDAANHLGTLMQKDDLTDGLEYTALNGQDFLWVVLNGSSVDTANDTDVDHYINKGSILVDDTARFRTHVEVARLFGKDYKGHQSATIDLDENWVIWFPKFYKNGDWHNQISDDGKTVTMKYIPGGSYGKNTTYPHEPNGKSIIFGHKIDQQTKEKYYEFVGVFTKLQGTSALATCHRLADALYIDGKGNFSI